MVLPLVKLGALVLKQASKPVANIVKARAANKPGFRRVCVSWAQAYHRFEARLSARFMGFEARVITPLDEQKAIDKGADVLGEIVIFTIAGSIVAFEYERSAKKDAEKAAKIEKRFDLLEKQIQLLSKQQDEVLHRLYPGEFDPSTESFTQEYQSASASSSAWYSWIPLGSTVANAVGYITGHPTSTPSSPSSSSTPSIPSSAPTSSTPASSSSASSTPSSPSSPSSTTAPSVSAPPPSSTLAASPSSKSQPSSS